jgi:hypothetical protein
MTRFTIGVACLFVLLTAFSTPAFAQSGAQIAFTIPKPKLAILEAVRNGTIDSLLLAVGLDKKLEESFPSKNPSSPTEVTVRIFAKALGIPAYVFPRQVVRSNGQTWAEALGASSPTGGGGGGSGEGLGAWEPPPIVFPGGFEFCGGGPSHSIYEDFKIIVRCGSAPSRGGGVY